MNLSLLGNIKSLASRAVPDYAVVPILGCNVNVMVQEVVTNAWLVSDIPVHKSLDLNLLELRLLSSKAQGRKDLNLNPVMLVFIG